MIICKLSIILTELEIVIIRYDNFKQLLIIIIIFSLTENIPQFNNTY